jgi:hypothetical protein
MLRIIPAFAAIFITAAAVVQYTPAAAQSKAPAAEEVLGHYRFESGLIMSVEKSRNVLTVRQLGQQPQTLSASPEGEFSYANGKFYLTFDLGPQGSTKQDVAQTLHVHFDNNNLPAARIDAAVAKKAADDFETRIKNQTHDPACEQTLRRVIDEIRTGKPDYSKLMPAVAQAIRQQLPMLEPRLQKVGAVKDVKFKGVGRPTGREKFDVTFEGSRSEWRIQCLANGWIGNLDIR